MSLNAQRMKCGDSGADAHEDSQDGPTALIVMGVSGSGKTVLAQELSRMLGWTYAEGDDFHPRDNIRKMASGVPLVDADRWGWLESIAAWMDAAAARGQPVVVSCSALKRSYRDVLRRPGAVFVCLHGSTDVLRHRIEARVGHFMKVGMLDSQLADFEPPADDERHIDIDVGAGLDPHEEALSVLRRLGMDGNARSDHGRQPSRVPTGK